MFPRSPKNPPSIKEQGTGKIQCGNPKIHSGYQFSYIGSDEDSILSHSQMKVNRRRDSERKRKYINNIYKL